MATQTSVLPRPTPHRRLFAVRPQSAPLQEEEEEDGGGVGEGSEGVQRVSGDMSVASPVVLSHSSSLFVFGEDLRGKLIH